MSIGFWGSICLESFPKAGKIGALGKWKGRGLSRHLLWFWSFWAFFMDLIFFFRFESNVPLL